MSIIKLGTGIFFSQSQLNVKRNCWVQCCVYNGPTDGEERLLSPRQLNTIIQWADPVVDSGPRPDHSKAANRSYLVSSLPKAYTAKSKTYQ